jgi:ethanolamine utilization protein EutA
MEEGSVILSVGIDIGTTTTQIVFSRLTLQNINGFGMAKQIRIVRREILYESGPQFTALSGPDEVDAKGVGRMVRQAYLEAGICPEQVDTGAIIVTGESSRKQNARAVCEEVSQFAGGFIATEAGPDLESVLAGKGAGCGVLSERPEYAGKILCNLDIGGGTTNLCCFRDGTVVDTGCYDIGGRLIRVDERGSVTYIAPKIEKLLRKRGISVKIGRPLAEEAAVAAADAMAEVLLQAAGLAPAEPEILSYLETNHGLSCRPEYFTLSGGVSDCLTKPPGFPYGDVGVYLGRAVRASAFFEGGRALPAAQTLRATVIGAGSFSISLSGSTIFFQNCPLPLKSLPVLRLPFEAAPPDAGEMMRVFRAHRELVGSGSCAISLRGDPAPSFREVEELADFFAGREFQTLKPLVLITETDMAASLGAALRRRLGRDAPLLCIDAITCTDGDFVDIGLPVCGGKTIPVIVKTLIFQ